MFDFIFDKEDKKIKGRSFLDVSFTDVFIK